MKLSIETGRDSEKQFIYINSWTDIAQDVIFVSLFELHIYGSALRVQSIPDSACLAGQKGPGMIRAIFSPVIYDFF